MHPTLPRTPTDVPQAMELLGRLRQLQEHPVETWWESFEPSQWPTLFRLLTLAGDLPSFSDHGPLKHPPAELWPQLAEVSQDMMRLQRLVQSPRVPSTARTMDCQRIDDETARQELTSSHCVTVEALLDPSRHQRLESLVDSLRPAKENSWGTLERSESPGLFALFDEALAAPGFARLTGYRAARDTYTLTLSLQSLQRQGIGWHQDLYWPKEWVGEDVFAVLYGLGDDDTQAKGGAFLYYSPWHNELRAVYRRRHQATILWNGRRPEERILHAVSNYLGEDSSRHLIILQCLRRQEARGG